MVTGQAGNSRLAGLVFIKTFDGGVNEAQMGHHRLSGTFRVTGDNRLHDRQVLFGEASEYRRDEIHPLAALLD